MLTQDPIDHHVDVSHLCLLGLDVPSHHGNQHDHTHYNCKHQWRRTCKCDDLYPTTVAPQKINDEKFTDKEYGIAGNFGEH